MVGTTNKVNNVPNDMPTVTSPSQSRIDFVRLRPMPLAVVQHQPPSLPLSSTLVACEPLPNGWCFATAAFQLLLHLVRELHNQDTVLTDQLIKVTKPTSVNVECVSMPADGINAPKSTMEHRLIPPMGHASFRTGCSQYQADDHQS